MLPHQPSPLTLFRSGCGGLETNRTPVDGVPDYEQIDAETQMVPLTEEMRLRLAALDDVTDLHKEVTQEHGMPPFGTQNQPMDFILGDPELRRALTLGRTAPILTK